MPFETVAETLLKGGVAPRHVRRYVRELDDHLGDLTERQREAGYDGDDAASRARAALGGDGELAQAMLDQPGLRSWPARLPWLVFGLLPPVLTAVAGLALYAVVYFIGNGAAKIGAVLPVPQDWLTGFSMAAMTAINVLAVPVIAVALAWLAERQRLKLSWPLLGIALLLLLTPMFTYKFGDHHSGYLRMGYGLVIPLKWNTILHHWQLLLSHALALLPAVWLVRRHKSAA
jgi:hypothetical protein